MSISDSLWEAPAARGPVTGKIRVPGSKSLTNREMVLSTLADGPSLLRGALWSRDTQLMLDAIKSLGAKAKVVLPDSTSTSRVDIEVSPAHYLSWRANTAQATSGCERTGSAITLAEVDCGLSGTVMRFIPPLAVSLGVSARFDGDPQAYLRPQATLIDALRQLGAVIVEHGDPGSLPFTVQMPSESARLSSPAESLTTPVVTIDSSGSSQFVSALLLIGAALPQGLFLRARGKLPSLAHVEMTIDCLAQRGVTVHQVKSGYLNEWKVDPAPIAMRSVRLETDLSNAGPFLAAAAVTGGEVSILDWPEHTTQAGDAWREIMPRLGVKISWENGTLTARGPAGGASALHGIDCDLSAYGELTPTLGAICALSSEPSRIRGIGHLRGHETDRLKALVTEVERLGGRARASRDEIEFLSPVTKPGVVESYHDHRMATFGAILGLKLPGLRVREIETTAKTLPDFVQLWSSLEGLA
ncbi:3-phosphoshikimate 1-carboxyvinyltransferase [Boudabousia marimammalium]|uniref:3-phosphoshikimate 1-carboxyvinyltransferase n=1 Tax=Boudabousia marimammalium TaxID=156892 RepID=A0A1Q5PRJ2_9ACTO|nr:3-phosphoshikimate 1-carboxyvinyltransferase [Boudabousia marimammalium]OKL50187.1 3-phosphoshikimate 1-carboxyvinyltransferase [Boudabousia marimammalium]